MAKKKAIKLAAASAVAASAFVAAAPAQTDAASNVAVEVSKAVTQMKKAYHTYSDVTAQGKFAPIADVYKEYNAAKKAYANAKAVVTKAGGSAKEAYLAQLDATYNEYIAKRVVTYIDAFNYATALEDKKEALEAALEEKEWEKAEELYHEISYELNTRTVILHRVYGQTARNLLVDAFKVEAQDTRDSITNEVSVKMYYDKAKDLVAEGKLEDAKKAMDHVADYVAKLDKDTDFGAYLLTQVSEVKAAYEAKLAPAVESVSAINAKEVQIQFGSPVTKASVLTGTSVQNITFSPVGTATAPGALTGSLSADGKTLTVTATNSFSGSYTVVATDSIEGTNGKKLSEYKEVVSLKDTVRPTVGQAVYNSNNVATFTFSEPIDVADNAALASALTLKDASGATYAPTVVLAADKKSFTLDLNAGTFVTGKTYTLTVTSLKDFAGNLITPNPLSVTVEKKVVDNVAPTVSSISSSQAGYVVVNFSEKVSANANNEVAVVGGVTADLDTNASLDASGTVLTVRNASFNGIKDITVTGFADVAGNAGTAKTALVNFPVDSVKPVVSSSAVKVIDNKNYVVLTFSEDVTVSNAGGSTITGTYVTDNGVEKTMAAIDASVAANVSMVTGTKNQVKILVDSQEKGKYNVSLPANLVTDVVGNANVAVTSTYTIGANTSETTKPTIVDSTPLTSDLDGIVVQVADNNTVTIEFSEKLATSSLNLNNFLVEGVAVAEKAVFTDTDQDTIKLTLKEGAIKTSGTYNFTVQNVSDVAGNVMTSVTQPKAFVDNDAPGLTSAALTSNDVAGDTSVITLTFDEAIDAATIAEGSAVADFDIFVDGVALGTANVTEAIGTATNTVTLSIDRALTATEAAKTLTIKPATGFDVADLAGNKLPTFTSVTVSK